MGLVLVGLIIGVILWTVCHMAFGLHWAWLFAAPYVGMSVGVIISLISTAVSKRNINMEFSKQRQREMIRRAN